MAEQLKSTDKRTCMCGELGEQNIGQQVCVMGWAQRQRDLGQLIFIDLRDRTVYDVFINEKAGRYLIFHGRSCKDNGLLP